VFVKYHYLDFLERNPAGDATHPPDLVGWNFWTSGISECVFDLNCIHGKRMPQGWLSSIQANSSKLILIWLIRQEVLASIQPSTTGDLYTGATKNIFTEILPAIQVGISGPMI